VAQQAAAQRGEGVGERGSVPAPVVGGGAGRTTGLVYPVWAMVAMALSVTTIFVNSIGGRPRLLFEAIGSVGRTHERDPEPEPVGGRRKS